MTTLVPAWLPPLLRAGEVAEFDPNAFNAGRPELKGAWFAMRQVSPDESTDGRRYVARADGWPACPTCEEDELHEGEYCLRCQGVPPLAVTEHARALLAERAADGRAQ